MRVKVADVIQLVNGIEGESEKKKNFLENLAKCQADEILLTSSLRIIASEEVEREEEFFQTIDFDGYKDYQDYLHILRKRLSILLFEE